uniref:Uncharacterized protein n=1 Tax=Caenorhabditis japonica TaxID=281687 RepID=A0A8R1HXV0_CAEJA
MCDERVVDSIINSKILKSVEILMLILSILAIPPILVTFRNCLNSNFFHINIRLIAAFHCVCLFIHCDARCFLTRVPYIFGLFGASYSTVFMVIERTIATRKYKKYENRQKTLGVYLLVGQVNKSANPYYLIFPEFVAIFVNIIAFVQFSRLIRINRNIRISDTTNSLGQKYQVEENLSIIAVLRVFTKCDFGFILIYFTLGIPFHFFAHFMDNAAYYAIFESTKKSSDTDGGKDSNL